jgi:hypothetical protein
MNPGGDESSLTWPRGGADTEAPGPRYDPAKFWNGVAWRLRLRGFDPDLTGPGRWYQRSVP